MSWGEGISLMAMEASKLLGLQKSAGVSMVKEDPIKVKLVGMEDAEVAKKVFRESESGNQ